MFKFNKLFGRKSAGFSHSYIYNLGEPEWSKRDYHKFADEAYSKNVIASRCINMIAQGAASVPWHLHKVSKGRGVELQEHPLLNLLEHPNPCYAGAEFFENIYAYRLISGNSFVLAVGPEGQAPKELHVLRPDRVRVIEGKHSLPRGYAYQLDNDQKRIYPVNNITGKSQILHLRTFNPLDDWYGMSPIESAAYSIDQHNQAAIWNQSLLKHGARPSGAVIFNGSDGRGGNLSQEQFDRLKEQVDESYSGAMSAGRPILLEGGLEWKEMSLSPKDMDFIEAKNGAAREIALSFGVPPQLIGIPGDNTYSNMQEARIALWEETILPLLDHMVDALNHWLVPCFGQDLKLSYNKDGISALAAKQENLWLKLETASFMTTNEKRAMVGLSPLKGGDDFRYPPVS